MMMMMTTMTTATARTRTKITTTKTTINIKTIKKKNIVFIVSNMGIVTESALWADLVSKLQCPSVVCHTIA